MKRTMIISAFPGCGKTYLCEHQNNLRFDYRGVSRAFSFCDSDSSHYEKSQGWEKRYVDDIEKKIGTVDFVFISQHQQVLAELELRKIPFVVVAPDNSKWLPDDEKKLIKQQWFGRFVLRDNSHIKDFDGWLSALKVHYDEWTSEENLTKHNPVSFFLLKENQYISSIIEDLYRKKENYEEYSACTEGNIKQIDAFGGQTQKSDTDFGLSYVDAVSPDELEKHKSALNSGFVTNFRFRGLDAAEDDNENVVMNVDWIAKQIAKRGLKYEVNGNVVQIQLPEGSRYQFMAVRETISPERFVQIDTVFHTRDDFEDWLNSLVK